MCGIVGYVGKQQAAPLLLRGLAKLEYRGYDSAGIAVFHDKAINVVKAKGRLKILSEMTDGGKQIPGTLGIGHTRWATHGEPSDVNSHPHLSNSGKFAVVHNGIIENYMELKKHLENEGCVFLSETDTEVIAHMVEHYYNGNLLDTVIEVMNHLEGSYAMGILCVNNPNEFIAVKKDSPLIVGVSEDGNFVASDIPAILEHTRDIYLLEDNEVVVLRKDSVKIYNEYKEIVPKELFHVNWDISAAEKGGYEHFMFKEIMEQPNAVRDTISPRIQDGKVVLDDLQLPDEYIKDLNKIYIVACGSAYHVGMVAKYVIEDLVRIPVAVDLASEFRYRNPLIDDHTLVIVISQSGETADTLAALREAKKLGAKILSIVNVVGSSIARESDHVLYTWAGPEIAVATTKAYTTQLNVAYLIALYFAKVRGQIDDQQMEYYCGELLKLPEVIQKIVNHVDGLQYLASQSFNADNIFFLGRGIDYAVALEGSLKLKEISYIHSEAYAAGELKHGTISLIEDGTLVVALATQDNLFDKLVSNIKEVKARGAKVIALVFEDEKRIEEVADYVIYIPRVEQKFAASPAVIPLQIFAYYVSLQRGCDVDKPRNLAKSVTVE